MIFLCTVIKRVILIFFSKQFSCQGNQRASFTSATYKLRYYPKIKYNNNVSIHN